MAPLIKRPMRPFWVLLTLVYMGAIFFLSSQEGTGKPLPFVGADKVIHAIVFGGLGALLSRVCGWNHWWTPFLLGSLYGVSDEVHQLYVAGRTCDFADMLADTVGVGLGLLLVQKRTSS
jgi:VanZ family protein